MKICFIGGGNMASALIGGLLAKGHDRGSIAVVEPQAEARDRLQARFGVTSYAECEAAATATDVIVFAVKPQYLFDAATTLRPQLGNQLVISVAAGIRISDLSRWLGDYAKVVRTMPNLPALIGSGVAGLYALPKVTDAERQRAEAILSAVGETVWVANDAQIDAITAVSGSGPAYFFYFVEALEQGAEKLGFTKDQAAKLAMATFRGAALLASQSPDPPSVLRAQVTSKGGTTAAALARMESAGVKEVIVTAVEAAAERGRELGEQYGSQQTDGDPPATH